MFCSLLLENFALQLVKSGKFCASEWPLAEKAFSPKRGLIFTVNGASAPPPKFPVHTPAPPPPGRTPPPPRDFPAKPHAPGERAAGARGRGGGGGAEAPFTAKTSPLFGEKALETPFEAPICPKPPETPNFPDNPALLRNPPRASH